MLVGNLKQSRVASFEQTKGETLNLFLCADSFSLTITVDPGNFFEKPPILIIKLSKCLTNSEKMDLAEDMKY